MQYFESPEVAPIEARPKVFMAGGITGCPDWQAELKTVLEHTDAVLVNPRRENFPIHDPSAAADQIAWEFDALQCSQAILFWFPHETICPIVLFELGRWSWTNKPIFVGVHPDYQRRQDVDIQMRLARPEVPVVHTLHDLAQQVRKWRKR